MKLHRRGIRRVSGARTVEAPDGLQVDGRPGGTHLASPFRPLVNLVHEVGDGVRIGGSFDPMPKVEDVPRLRPGLHEDPPDLGPQSLPGGKEGRRIEIPLDRQLRPHDGPGPREGQAPIDPQDVGAGQRRVLQEGRPLVGKVDDGEDPYPSALR